MCILIFLWYHAVLLRNFVCSSVLLLLLSIQVIYILLTIIHILFAAFLIKYFWGTLLIIILIMLYTLHRMSRNVKLSEREAKKAI